MPVPSLKEEGVDSRRKVEPFLAETIRNFGIRNLYPLNSKRDHWLRGRIQNSSPRVPCLLHALSSILFTIFTNPSARAEYDTRSIFKWSLTGFNPEFSFSYTSCLTKAEEPSLSYYLPIAGGRITGFIPFPRVLVLCEMQSVSSRI